MKRTTVRLSGHSKDRFLERFFSEEAGLDPEVAARLAARSKKTFAGLIVRKAAVMRRRRVRVAGASPEKSNLQLPRSEVVTAAQAHAAGIPTADFDPYAFGLVPVYQREGREGLLAKLGSIECLDQLRQMAKAQQIVLPQSLRMGDAALDSVRVAIAEAVAKRIADRRAAAG
jgi:hypothetical protein